MRRLINVFRAAGLGFSQDGCAMLAQAIAFNAVFAVFPLLMLAFAVLGFVYGDTIGAQNAVALLKEVAPGVRGIVLSNLQHIVANRSLSGLVAVIALVWSGKNLFQTLAFALDRALGVPQGRPLVKDILVAIVTLPVLAGLLVVATAIPLVISFVVHYGGFPTSALATQVAGYGVSIVLVFVITWLLYNFLPNRRVGIWFGVPGALVTTFLWEAAQIAFAIYSIHVDYTKVYGALAAFALLLIWFYYMGTIFLFGAQVSAKWLELGAKAEPARDVALERRTA
jgi:membrane protein